MLGPPKATEWCLAWRKELRLHSAFYLHPGPVSLLVLRVLPQVFKGTNAGPLLEKQKKENLIWALRF